MGKPLVGSPLVGSPSHDPLAEGGEGDLDAELDGRRAGLQVGVVPVHRGALRRLVEPYSRASLGSSRLASPQQGKRRRLG